MSGIRIESYDQLKTFLRSTHSVSGGDQYDFVGMVHLLTACLDNLQANALDAELEDIAGSFTDSQKAFLQRLVAYL